METYEKELNYLRRTRKIKDSQWYLANELLKDQEKYEDFSNKIQNEFQRIQTLASEANIIANEMEQDVFYHVILQISNSYLKPNERCMENICEVAVEVRQGNFVFEIWNIETFEWRFSLIKDQYQQWKNKGKSKIDCFLNQQSEKFIGVANIHLKALLYGSKVDYIIPIINTSGEFSGSLYVVLDPAESYPLKTLSNFQINSTTQGSMSDGIGADIEEQSLSKSQTSLEDEGIEENLPLSNEELSVKFSIKEIRDLPKINAEHIICRYTFINPKLDQTIQSIKYDENSRIFTFNHEEEYHFPLNENFLSICTESAVSIEIFYENLSIKENHSKNVREISQRWKNAREHLEFCVQIQELDQQGQWNNVDVDEQQEILTGGIYRLKQGQSKRLITTVRLIPRQDRMPLTLHAIRSVEIGSIVAQKFDAPRQLDSYQEEDLNYIKSQWLDAIEKQQDFLRNQINEQTRKSLIDIQREKILLDQIVYLAHEKDIVISPPIASGIPGAPSNWTPPKYIENHRPIIFLKTDIAGQNAFLDEENITKMFTLSLIQNASSHMQAIALWDPTIHESSVLNQVTPSDTIIYLIVRTTILISEPIEMEIILRKRIAVTISKTDSWWPRKTLKNFLGYETFKSTSVVYEIVSHIPRIHFPIEDETYSIEKYLQYASKIDTILLLDKLRQEVLLTENSVKLQKSTSAPDITSIKKSKSKKKQILKTEIELNESTPSLSSRTSFIENQHIQPISKTTFEIKHTIDLDDIKPEIDEKTLELKYTMPTNPVPKPTITNENQEFSIGSRVLVTTGHSIINKEGIIRFIGEIAVQKGIWYGVELNEPVGKNNGSLNEKIYFQCETNHGVFVRCDKMKLIN